MHSQDYTHSTIPNAVRLVAMVALATAMLVMPGWTQNAIPAAARQAATMPAFAQHLHPAATPQLGRRFPASTHARKHRGSPLDETFYDNGPVNGQVDAWTVGFGFSVSDTIQINQPGGTLTGIQFWLWVEPGDTVSNVEVQIGSTGYFSNNWFDGVVSLTQSNCFTNDFGFNVCLVSGNFAGLNPNGNSWLTLANANTVEGNPVYWDENSGVGCESPGCPSQAQEDTLGTIPSEAFTLTGMTTTTTTEPPPCLGAVGNFQILHNFTGQEGGISGGNGVVIDQAGNLYGTTSYGGDDEAGFAFKLARWAGWVLDPLYIFPEDYDGDGYWPTGVIVGPNGSLYGGASGGSGNCGGTPCGMVFNLTPPLKACGSVLCSWTEGIPYNFSGGADGSGTINVSAFDQEGNLYGTSTGGGQFGAGTVFKLTPSGEGWTESILYSFTGRNDAFDVSAPTQVLLGNDGNLYGVAQGGEYSSGVVFQLTPSGDHWTESILHSFQYAVDGYNPSYLVQDSAGNLYGIAITALTSTPPIFLLSKSGNGWVFSEYYVTHLGENDQLYNLAIDAAGNLYGTGGGRWNGFIFQASHGSAGWQYGDLVYFYGNFPASGALALDAQGNLYGTTRQCGTDNEGIIWEASP
jgi:uncharacterized repeat protein (TIGR03803 family)